MMRQGIKEKLEKEHEELKEKLDVDRGKEMIG